MKEIKTSLEQLTALFAQSASDEELPLPIRRFSAQLTVLTGHVRRVDAAVKVLDGASAEVMKVLTAIVTQMKSAPAQQAAPQTSAPPEANSGEEGGEDEESKAAEMVEQVLADAEREAAATNAKVTPLRPSAPSADSAPVAPTGGVA